MDNTLDLSQETETFLPEPKKLTLDLCKKSYSAITVAQYDKDSRIIIVTITDSGKLYRLNNQNQKAIIKCLKPDKTVVLNDCEILESGTVKIVLTEQICAVHGKCEGQLMISNIEGKILHTMSFIINVDKSVFPDDSVTSSYEFSALNRLIGEETERINTVLELEENVNECEAIRQANEEVRIENEDCRISNEGNRETAEGNREVNTATAVQNANNATTAAGNATVSANNATERANTSASEANTATSIANMTIQQMQALMADDNIVHTDKLGSPNGIATLDEEGYLSKSQIPDRTVDIIYGTLTENGEFIDTEGNLVTGGINKQYIDTNAGIPYIWSGIEYVATGSKLGLGFTSSSAFPGDRGLESENRITTLEEFHNNLSAEKVGFVNTDTSLVSANVQDAIEELSQPATSIKNGSLSSEDKIKIDNYSGFVTIDAILYASSWQTSNGVHTLNLPIADISNYNSCNIEISGEANPLQVNSIMDAEIESIKHGETGMLFTATGIKPTVDIPIKLVMGTSLNCVEKPVYMGSGNAASEVSYNNVSSGLTGTNVQDVLTEIDTTLTTKAPLNHASTATTYGAGTGSAYGHVKLSDVYASAVATANSSLGASQYSVYSAYNQLNTSKLPLSGGTLTGALTMANDKYIKCLNTPGTAINLIGINNINNIHMGAYFGSGDTDPGDIPVYLHAGGNKYTFHSTYFGSGANSKIPLGTPHQLWTTVYAKTGTINTSDRTKKHDINDLTALHEQLFLRLSPKSFVFNDGDRVHIGAISQDVEDSMLELGILPEHFAGFCKDIRYEYTEFNNVDGEPIESSKVPVRDDDGNIVYDYSLRYQEFIFLTIHMVQKLYDRVEKLENKEIERDKKIDLLEEEILALKTH